MENQAQNLDNQNQGEQQAKYQNTDSNTVQSAGSGVVPEHQLAGSDADTDSSMDISNAGVDIGDDENDTSGVGAQTDDVADRNNENDTKDFDVDESTGGAAI